MHSFVKEVILILLGSKLLNVTEQGTVDVDHKKRMRICIFNLLPGTVKTVDTKRNLSV